MTISRENARADILIVDDIAENLEFLSAELAARRYFTRPVNSGKLALMAANALPPDLILLDILMPDMDGYDTCRAFKADGRLSDIPIIFISGVNETIDKVRAFQIGAVDYITKPFQIEEVLARIETHLTLYRQRRELEQQRALKARFLSMATHEFRTPLAVIKSAAYLLRKYQDRLSAEERLERLDMIDHEVEELDNLIEDILLYNKMETSRLEFHAETVDIKAFCDRLVEKFRAISGPRRLDYQAKAGLASADVDPNLLDHILSNLLSNALKYSAADSTVHFSVTQDKAYLTFKVADEGIGIPPEEQQHVFSPFYRASNTGAIGGTGLGLAIVKQYVDKHGGSVSLESTPGVGTTVTVRIPWQRT